MIWTFAVQPFIDKHLYDLLLRAAGIRFPPSRDRLSKLLGSLPRPGAPQATKWVPIPSPAGPEVDERHLVTVDQRMCCVEIKGKISDLWRKRLVGPDPQIAEAASAMARAQEREAQAMGVATGQPPVPISAPAVQAGSVVDVPPSDPQVSDSRQVQPRAGVATSAGAEDLKPDGAVPLKQVNESDPTLSVDDGHPTAAAPVVANMDIPALVNASQSGSTAKQQHSPDAGARNEDEKLAKSSRIDAALDSRPAPIGNTFDRHGEVWSMSYEGESCYRSNLVGIEYLTELIENAGRWFPATGLEATAGPAVASRELDVFNDATIADRFTPQERSDNRARREYETEALRLKSEIADARDRGDLGRVEALTSEFDLLVAHMQADKGLLGRSRTFTDDRERARKRVSNAIRKAIDSIREDCPALADHLKQNIKMGAELMYRDAQTAWKISRD